MKRKTIILIFLVTVTFSVLRTDCFSAELPDDYEQRLYDELPDYTREVYPDGINNESVSRSASLSSILSLALSSFSETLKKFADVSSGVSGMFVSIFSFLPWWSTAILGFAIVAVVILRFVGR